MFVSPLSRILVVLTLVAFAAAIGSIEFRGGATFYLATGVAMTLLSVSIARLVTEGSAFDDRAFHRTRPGGERMALRRLNLLLASIVLAVAAIAAVRGWIYHLGWQSVSWAAAIILVPVALITFAVATGVNLSLQGKGSIRKVILILLAGPIGLTLVTMIVPYLGKWIIPPFSAIRMGMPVWMNTPTWAGTLGVAGYGISWWLASRWRQGKAALLLAGLTGILIQIRSTKVPLVPAPELPTAAVKIERLPTPPPSKSLSESVRPKFKDEWGMKDPQIQARVRATGLGENDFIDFNLMIDPEERRARGNASPIGLLSRNHDIELLKDRDRLWFQSDRGVLMNGLASKLPGRPKLESQQGRTTFRIEESVSNPIDRARAPEAPWTLDGVQFQLDHLGSFPVRARSSYRLDGGGMVATWDLKLTEHDMSLGFRLIQPDPPFVPNPEQTLLDGMYLRPAANFIWGIMVNESQTRALMVVEGKVYAMDNQRAFGSRWSDLWLNLRYPGNPHAWDEAEVLRSKIHLFVSRPVGRVNAPLPPP